MPARAPKDYSHIWIYVGKKKIPGWYLNGEYFDCKAKKYTPDQWKYRERN